MYYDNGLSSTTRSFQPLHGFTEIAGDNITTGVIKSADGQTWFNLKTGEIRGNFTFLAGSKGWENIQGLSKEFQDLWKNLGETWDKALNAYDLARLAQTAANGAADEAAKAKTMLAIYEAVFSNNTDILGGLILTSMIMMRTGGVVQSGIAANLNNNDLAFWAGGTYEQGLRLIQNLTSNVAKFAVTHSGNLYANDAHLNNAYLLNAYLEGEIKALRGTIGGLVIKNNYIAACSDDGTEKTILTREKITQLNLLASSVTLYEEDDLRNITLSDGEYRSINKIVGGIWLEAGTFFKEDSRVGESTTSGRYADRTIGRTIRYNGTVVDRQDVGSTFSAPYTGSYEVEYYVTIQVAAEGQSHWTGEVSFYLRAWTDKGSQKTVIGTDGMYSHWDASKYLYMSASASPYFWELRGRQVFWSPSGQYGLEITDSGVRKTSNYGANWTNI
jgi:hypothetical protein